MAITAFYLRAFVLLGKTDVLAASRHSDLDLGLTCRLFVIKTGDEAFFVSRGNRHGWRCLFTWKSHFLEDFCSLVSIVSVSVGMVSVKEDVQFHYLLMAEMTAMMAV